MQSKYMRFCDISKGFKRKTKTIELRNKGSNSYLGAIEWYSPWRQYVFYPNGSCVFSKGCLEDINAAIAELMEERKG